MRIFGILTGVLCCTQQSATAESSKNWLGSKRPGQRNGPSCYHALQQQWTKKMVQKAKNKRSSFKCRVVVQEKRKWYSPDVAAGVNGITRKCARGMKRDQQPRQHIIVIILSIDVSSPGSTHPELYSGSNCSTGGRGKAAVARAASTTRAKWKLAQVKARRSFL